MKLRAALLAALLALSSSVAQASVTARFLFRSYERSIGTLLRDSTPERRRAILTELKARSQRPFEFGESQNDNETQAAQAMGLLASAFDTHLEPKEATQFLALTDRLLMNLAGDENQSPKIERRVDRRERVLKKIRTDIFAGEDVMRLHYSRDSKLLLTRDSDKSLRSWDASSGASVRTPGQLWIADDRFHAEGPVYSPDGKTTALGINRKSSAALVIDTGHEEIRLKAHWGEGQINSLTAYGFSPDGKHFVSSSWSKQIKRWDTKTWKVDLKYEAPFRADRLQISKSGRRMVGSGEGDRFYLWDFETGKLLMPPRYVSSASGGVLDAQFLLGEGRLITSHTDGTLRVWDAGSNDPILVTEAQPQQIKAFGVLPNGRFAVCTFIGGISIVNLETGKTVWTELGHGLLQSVAIAPDLRSVAAYEYAGQVFTWDLKTLIREGALPSDVISPARDPASVSEASGLTARTLFRSYEGSVGTLLREATQERRRSLLAELQARSERPFVFGESLNDSERTAAQALSLIASVFDSHLESKEATQFLTLTERLLRRLGRSEIKSAKTELRVDKRDRRNMISRKSFKPGNHVQRLLYSRDSKTILTGSLNQPLRAWKGLNGQLIKSPGPPQIADDRPFRFGPAYSADGSTNVIGLTSGPVTELVIKNDEREIRREAHSGEGTHALSAFGFSPDGKHFVSASRNKQMKRWSTDTWTVDFSFELPEAALGLQISENGRYMIGTGMKPSFFLWDFETGKLLDRWTADLSAARVIVQDVQFLNGDKHLISAHSDGTLRIWEVGSQIPLSVIQARSEPLVAFQVFPNRRFAVCVSGSGLNNKVKTGGISVVNLETGKVIWSEDGHGDFQNVAIAPDQRGFSASQGNGSVFLWNLKAMIGNGELPPEVISAARDPASTSSKPALALSSAQFHEPYHRVLMSGLKLLPPEGARKALHSLRRQLQGKPTHVELPETEQLISTLGDLNRAAENRLSEPDYRNYRERALESLSQAESGIAEAGTQAVLVDQSEKNPPPPISRIRLAGDYVRAFAIDPKERWALVKGSGKKTLSGAWNVWDLTIDSHMPLYEQAYEPSDATPCIGGPNGDWSASSAKDPNGRNQVVIRSTADWSEAKRLSSRLESVDHLEASPDGKWLLIFGTVHDGDDYYAEIWDTSNWKTRKSLSLGKGAPVGSNSKNRYTKSATFSPDSKSIIESGVSLQPKKHEIGRSGKAIKLGTKKLNGSDTIAFSKDGSLIAFGTPEMAQVVRADNGRLVAEFQKSELGFSTLAFSQDGRCLISGGDRGNIALWDLQNKKMLHSMRSHETPVQTIVSLPNSRYAQISHENGDLTIVDLEAEKEIWTWLSPGNESTPLQPLPTRRGSVFTRRGVLSLMDYRAMIRAGELPADVLSPQ